MSKTYFAWSNAERSEWIEMTGEEYYVFINKPENKGRHFIPVDDTEPESLNKDIWMEVSIEMYREWDRIRTERKRKLDKEIKNPCLRISVVSLDEVISTDDNGHQLTWADILSAQDDDTDSIICDALSQAITMLSEKEQEMLKDFFFKGKKTEQEVAIKYGMTQQAFSKHKKKILKKLKKFLNDRL